MGFPEMQESTWPVIFAKRKMEVEESDKMCLSSCWLTLWRTTKSSMNVTNDHDFSFLMANVLLLTTDFCLRDKSDLKYCTEVAFSVNMTSYLFEDQKLLSCNIKQVFVWLLLSC